MNKKRHAAVRVMGRKVLMKISSSTLVECRLRVGRQSLVRYSIEHPGCVVIIPQIADDRFLLVKQYRYAARAWIWEFPAGGMEKGESEIQSARRELREEVGHDARQLTKLVSFYPTPGISEEKMHLYLASKLYPALGQKDEDEEFEIREFSLKQIGRMIARGEIQDGKTLIGYFYLTGYRSFV